MTAHAVFEKPRPKSRNLLPLIPFAVAIASAGWFVSYELWPNWPSAPVSLDGPAIPVTVAGVLFNVPPAAIRAAVQRHPGAHERIDLAFLWPSLTPPGPDSEVAARAVESKNGAPPSPGTDNRLFVTIAALNGLLDPLARLRTVYPRYIETQAAAGPDGLAVVPFRAGTPYEGEDLVYFADRPEQFFALCSRPVRNVPGICIHERALDAAAITLRFPREWLQDWRSIATGFDRLMVQLRGQNGRPRLN